jgi:hypothetical protein
MNNIIDINNYKEEMNNIILSKKVSYDNNSKYYIYSHNSKLENADLNNVIIKIPPIRLLYNYSFQTYNQINFPINPNYSKTKKFCDMISYLENILQELLNKPKLEWVTNIKKIKNIKNIKLNYFGKNEVKIITESNLVKEIKDFEMGSEVEFSVHISHLWLKDKKVGINYEICQIKYTSLKNMIGQSFFTPMTVKSTSVVVKEESKNKDSNNAIPKRPGIMFPTAQMILEQKSLLKKI